MNSAPGIVVGTNRDSVKVDSGRVSSGPIPANPPLAPAMAVPFYAGTEVWSAPAPTDPWAPQGQFIHQIDDIRYQHYPGYQPAAGYQQAGFITEQTSAFQPQYVNATNGNPATSPPQGNVTPRSTGSYTQVHTPTPSPNPSTPHVNGHRNGVNVHYVEENYVNGTTFNSESSSMVPPASTTPNSRSSSAHLEASETNSKTSGYMSGNEMPGYPLNSPQCQSSCNSSGYPGQSIQSEFGDQSTDGNSYQTSNGTNHTTQKSPSYTQASPGTYQNYQNYNNQGNADESHKSAKSSISPGSCHPSQKTSGMLSQNSSKNYNSNPSPQTYQEISPGQSRQNPPQYDNRTGNAYPGEHQNYTMRSPNSQSYGQISPNENGNQDKCNVNARIKSMIMNKQQNQQQNQSNNNYGGSNEGNMMSPHREMKSPSQQNVQLMSPVHQNPGMMSPVQNRHTAIMSPNHQNVTNSSPNSKESKSYVDKIQQNDYSEKKQVRVNENANHFLAFSHHLRDGSLLQPEGGGVQNWTGRPNPGSNCQINFQTNHCEPFQVSKNLKFESNNENIPSNNAMKYDASSDSRKSKTDYQDFESGAHYHENKPFQNCNVSGYDSRNYYQQQQQQPSDLIRNLEVNFPTKKMESGETVSNCLFKQEALDNFKDCREHKVFPGYQNVVASSCKLENSSYNAVVKQEDFRESGYCQFQNNYNSQESVSDFQTYKSNCSYTKSNRDEAEDTYSNMNLDYDKCGIGYGYEKPYVKSEYDEESTYCMNNFGYTNVKMENKDFKSECFGMKTHFVTSPTTKVEYPRSNLDCNARLESENGNEMSANKCLYPRISYAPNVKNMEVIDKRFIKRESEGKTKWEEYCKAREKEKSEDEEVKREKKNYLFEGDGGPIVLEKSSGAWCCRMGGIETPTAEHLRDGGCQGYQTADEFCPEKSENLGASNGNTVNTKQSSSDYVEKADSKSPGLDGFQENVERLKNNARTDVPDCQCFPPDKCPPEPGSYYTHLGAAASLSDLRKDVETRTGQKGKALRIEKICYTGKEGKTTQGCPLAKWVIRRSGLDEKFLIIVKHRQGHTCSTAWIVVCLVAWEGVPTSEADKVYNLLSHKLNKFGLPTTRRCATNEPRTCACQGLDPDTCGASFSFGCSWSMYYNGCKYARSKTVRKFRLSVRSEEQEVEERMHVLATLLSPLYSTLAPDAFNNQTLFEREATECRLGFKPGRPFSGVTACIDFCAHSHRDLHNMNNGCTVVVTLTKHRSLSKPDDEQLHVLPLYIMDETDEFGCKESQEAKYKNGSIECLTKFPCEVRVRAVPLQPCRRHGKKRKADEPEAVMNNMFKDMNSKNLSSLGMNNSASPLQSVDMQSMIDGLEMQLQSSQVSSTVMDSPVNMYQGWGYQNLPESEMCSGGDERWNRSWTSVETRKKQNWLNSNQTPPQWDYSGFPVQKDIDPDSTTNQYQASRSGTTASVSNCYNTYGSCKSPSLPSTYQSQSTPLWNQIPQTCGRRNHYPSTDDDSKSRERVMTKTDEDRDCLRSRLGDLSPQTPSKHWTDYSSNQIPIHQNPSQFRTPRVLQIMPLNRRRSRLQTPAAEIFNRKNNPPIITWASLLFILLCPDCATKPEAIPQKGLGGV